MERIGNTRKILVVNGTAKNYSPAEEYGELKFLSLGSTNLLNISRHIADIVPVLLSLKDNPPYLLVSGYGLHIGIAISCFIIVFGWVDLLVWDAKKRKYNKVFFDQDQIKNMVKILK